MNHDHFPKSAIRFLSALAVVALNGVGTAVAQEVLQISDPLPVNPSDRLSYYNAMEDAKVATPAEVKRDLLALVPWNDEINARTLRHYRMDWKVGPLVDQAGPQIKVAAFMSDQTYKAVYAEHIGEKNFSLQKSLWVTVSPELRNRFINGAQNGEQCPPPRERIVRLLGLNPAGHYDVVVEMYVDARNLFRPSADPGTTDHESEIAYEKFMDAKNAWAFPMQSPFMDYTKKVFFENFAEPHRKTFKVWYSSNAKETYTASLETPIATWGNPWTRLGYTYDWGNPKSKVGLSEFMIRLDPPVVPDGRAAVSVELVRAIRAYEPNEWSAYYRCTFGQDPEQLDSEALSSWMNTLP